MNELLLITSMLPFLKSTLRATWKKALLLAIMAIAMLATAMRSQVMAMTYLCPFSMKRHRLVSLKSNKENLL